MFSFTNTHSYIYIIFADKYVEIMCSSLITMQYELWCFFLGNATYSQETKKKQKKQRTKQTSKPKTKPKNSEIPSNILVFGKYMKKKLNKPNYGIFTKH